MTTYTITQVQLERLYKLADPFDNETIGMLTALKPNSQEPIAYMDADGNTSDNNDSGCFNIKLFDHPAPMSKETAERVLAALDAVNDLIEHQFTGTREGMNDLQYACDGAREAITIMHDFIEGMK
jgi:cytochrome c556